MEPEMMILRWPLMRRAFLSYVTVQFMSSGPNNKAVKNKARSLETEKVSIFLIFFCSSSSTLWREIWKQEGWWNGVRDLELCRHYDHCGLVWNVVPPLYNRSALLFIKYGCVSSQVQVWFDLFLYFISLFCFNFFLILWFWNNRITVKKI